MHVLVSRDTYADLLPAAVLDQFSVERRAKHWHEAIKEADRTDIAVFVAEDATDNTILAFACCSRQRSEILVEKGFNGEFQTIYVLPQAQGCGIGRTLMVEMARFSVVSQYQVAPAGCCVTTEARDDFMKPSAERS